MEVDGWSPIPGTGGIEIYPVIRKPSVICSNSFIIKFPSFIMIIDPGADPEQIERIRSVVRRLKEDLDRPVYILLTHCHIDHCLAVDRLMDKEVEGKLLCHSAGADAIEKGDTDLTLASMNGSTLPVCSARFRLFDNTGQGWPGDKDLLDVKEGFLEFADGRIIEVISIPVGGEDSIDIFQTPGHSPDSICCRIGSFLFTGDLHLAATPGIAGKTGWDNVSLTRSLRTAMEGIRKYGITHVLPGHGNVLTVDKAEKIFQDSERDAFQLRGLALFNRERSLYVSEYAILLLEEASTIFSIIAGRLLKVSYYLEMLEEEEQAETVMNLIDVDGVDRIIEEFHGFIAELKIKKGAPLISKAVHFSRNIEKIFEPEKVSALFDPYFIRRIKNLLSDFVNVVYGIEYKDLETHFDLNDAVAEMLSRIRKDPLENERIFETLDDDGAFLDELTRRIAQTPLFSTIQLTFLPCEEDVAVTADRAMLQDMVTALLEQFAISGVGSAILESGREGEDVFLSIAPENGENPFLLRDSKALYLKHTARLVGCSFETVSAGGKETYRYSFTHPSRNHR